MAHGGIDSDGDGRCYVYETAQPEFKEVMEGCKYL